LIVRKRFTQPLANLRTRAVLDGDTLPLVDPHADERLFRLDRKVVDPTDDPLCRVVGCGKEPDTDWLVPKLNEDTLDKGGHLRS
jgi:hypothetical protein